MISTPHLRLNQHMQAVQDIPLPNIESLMQEATEVEAARQDPAKFAILYNNNYEAVFRFVNRRMNSRDMAADVTAQVFLKAMTHLQSYRHRGLPFVCWLYRIAGNELKQLFKTSNKQRTIHVVSAGMDLLVEEMEETTADKWEERMMTLLPNLPEDELLIIEMRYFEKRPFKEIGEILDITENNAKVKLYRILAKLKKQITSSTPTSTSKKDSHERQ